MVITRASDGTPAGTWSTFRSWDTDPVDVLPDPGSDTDLAEARRETGLDRIGDPRGGAA